MGQRRTCRHGIDGNGMQAGAVSRGGAWQFYIGEERWCGVVSRTTRGGARRLKAGLSLMGIYGGCGRRGRAATAVSLIGGVTPQVHTWWSDVGASGATARSSLMSATTQARRGP